MNAITIWLGVLMLLAFVVNIIVQMTKEFIPIPTKLWCIMVSVAVDVIVLLYASASEKIHITTLTIILAIVGAFVVAFVAMYGFDTFKELWERFKKGENINEDSKSKKL